MFNFLHPQPVDRPRPVAEQSVQHVHPALPALAPPTTGRAPIATPGAPIRFTVSYGLREYLAVLREHLPAMLVQRGMAHQGPGPGPRLLMALLVPPVFWFKKLRVGNCRFEIDAHGLARHSRTGTLALAWHEVGAVHRYGGAYLVAKARGGAMPLPYRCFSADERRRFDGWVAASVRAMQ